MLGSIVRTVRRAILAVVTLFVLTVVGAIALIVVYGVKALSAHPEYSLVLIWLGALFLLLGLALLATDE
ncbi:hypothetical protein [Methanopyrus sp.]